MSANDLVARSQELQRDSARIGVEFLATDLDTALTFADRALQAHNDPETRQRNQANARTGYDTVRRLLTNLDPKYLNEQQKTEFEEKLLLLRSKLAQLGEILEYQ